MAWQLIYTSAPRLLEAGRTGFGTVARHRAVSGMLAAAVERFSQFARLPGHDPRRIVHAYRILNVGSSTFHVLSCLQDAGSDYTGRTNHIAHHLIAEAREIRTLSAGGLTPADVLFRMAWRSSWSEGPRYLDPSEEINLSSFSPSTSHAWASVTGHPATAGILWSREAQKGCYVITPSGINGLELFRESMQVEPAHAWQTCFTTCLEPNDDVADFRWIALSSSSPMRTQVETSNRFVFDLTSPATLPEPPQREAPPPAHGTVSPGASGPAAPGPLVLGPAPRPPASVYEPLRSTATTAAAPPVSPMGGWSPEPRRKAAKSPKSFIGISLIIAAVMIIVVVGALLRQNNLQAQARADYEQKISQTWKNYRLYLNDTRKLLEDQPDIEEGAALLKSHDDFFRSMQQMLKQPGETIELSLPAHAEEDLKDLKKLLDEWVELHVSPWEKLQSGKATVTAPVILETYRQWQDSRTAKWKQLNDYLISKDIPPPDDAVVQSLKATAKEVLRHAEPARDTRTNWEEVFKLPGDSKNSSAAEALQWLQLWAELDDADANSYATAQTAASNGSLPEWLRKKAEGMKQRPDKKNEPKMAGKTDKPRTQVAQKPVVIIEDADAVSATNPIYLYLLQSTEDSVARIAGLQVSPDMRLFVGTAWERHPTPDGKTETKNGELKKWLSVSPDDSEELKFGPSLFAKLNEMILFSKDGRLTAIPEELRKSPDGVRIIVRNKEGSKVLFDLRIFKPTASQSALLPFVLKASLVESPERVESPELGALLSRFPSIHGTFQFKLRSPLNLGEPWDLTQQDGKWILSQKQPTSVQNAQAIKLLVNLIQALLDGIKSLENHKELLLKNQSGSEAKQSGSEAKIKQYDDGIASKQSELAEAKAKLAALKQPKELSKPILPSGEFTLYASPKAGTEIDICKVQMVPPAKSPATPTNKP
jgi:hypothetical protein